MNFISFNTHAFRKMFALLVMTAPVGTELMAQLNVVAKSDQIQEYTVENALPYDSLTNVENYAALPGQTLFMSGIKDSSRGYMDTFFCGNFLTEKPNIYGTEIPFPPRLLIWWKVNTSM